MKSHFQMATLQHLVTSLEFQTGRWSL